MKLPEAQNSSFERSRRENYVFSSPQSHPPEAQARPENLPREKTESGVSKSSWCNGAPPALMRFVWWSRGKSLAFSGILIVLRCISSVFSGLWWSYGKSLAFSRVLVWSCGESLAFSKVLVVSRQISQVLLNPGGHRSRASRARFSVGSRSRASVSSVVWWCYGKSLVFS